MPDESVSLRLSLVKPKAGNEQRIAQLQDDLVSYLATQPGFVHGYRITGGDSEEGRLGLVTLWRSDADADRSAQSAKVLSVRSELMMIVADEQRMEYSLSAQGYGPAPA